MPVDEVLREIENYYKSISGEVTGVKPSEEMSKAIKTIKGIDNARGFVPDIERKLPEIKAPTLIIWGKDDRVIPSSYANIFARAIPDARVRILDGAGHLPYIEKTEEFNQIVMDFLR